MTATQPTVDIKATHAIGRVLETLQQWRAVNKIKARPIFLTSTETGGLCANATGPLSPVEATAFTNGGTDTNSIARM